MLKTYLYIPEPLDQKISLTAITQKKSKAEIIRLALEKGMVIVAQQGTASAHILLKLTAVGKQSRLQGPTDSSARMDDLLWGKDWSKDA